MSNVVDAEKLKAFIIRIRQDQIDEFGRRTAGHDLVRRFGVFINNRIKKSKSGVNVQIKCPLTPKNQKALKKMNEFYCVYMSRWSNLSERYTIKDIWDSRANFVGYTDNAWKILAVRILSILHENRHFIPFEDHHSFHSKHIILEKGRYIYKLTTIAMELRYVEHIIHNLLSGGEE